MRAKTLATLVLALAGLVLTGCEDGEYCMAQWIAPGGHDHDSGSSSGSHKSLTGTWHGRAGTGQTGTTLRLTQNGNSLGGSWTWGAGDTRRCTGSIEGSSIVLKDQSYAGDTWYLSLSNGNRTLSGTGYKYGGGTYNVEFNR